MNPLVSIITPCYNGEKYIGNFLDSVLKQSYSPLELILINDGSADHTEQVVKSYKEKLENRGIRFIYIYQDNRGQAAALNRGLKIFTGEYLTWPDSDDFLMEDSIMYRVAFLEKNREYMLVRSNGLYVEEITHKPLRRISEDKNRFNEDIFEDLYLDRTYCCCGCYMIRAKAFLEIYPQRQIFESREGQNWQMLVPMASISKCGYIDKDLFCVVQRTGSHSRKQRSFEDQLNRIAGMEAILIHAFQVSSCDFNDCIQKVYEKHARMRLRIAAKSHNGNILSKQYQYLKANNWLTAQDKLIYFKGKHKIIDRTYQIGMAPVRFLLKLKRK